MGSADAYDAYLQKHAIRGQLISETPDPQLHTIIAIPATNESGLTTCLDSLFKCDPPVLPAEVVVLINSARNSSEEIVETNRRGYEEVRKWIRLNQMSQNRVEQNRVEKDRVEKNQAERNCSEEYLIERNEATSHQHQQDKNQDSDQYNISHHGEAISKPQEKLKFHVVLVEDLPDKHFGAGLARKLVMDETVRRLAWASERRRLGDEQTGRDVEDRGEADEVTTGKVDAGVTGGKENGSTSRLGSGTDAGQSREEVYIQKSAIGDGIIISLDADTVVRRDYLREVEKFFEGSPEMEGCSISFAHPLNQQEYNRLFYKPSDLSATPSKKPRSDQQLSADHISRDNDYMNQHSPTDSQQPGGSSPLHTPVGKKIPTSQFAAPLPSENFPPSVFDAVTNYELHQRYYLQAVRYTGYPYACHTVGSCFAVRAESYCRMGGMSRRKAGEDFYFIQKIAMHGRYGECRTTRVYPSPRPSDRVPFGTGPDISRQIDGGGELDASAKHPNARGRDGTGPDIRQSDSSGLDASVKHPNDRGRDGTGPDKEQPAVSGLSDASVKQLPPYFTYHPELFEHLRKFFALIPRLYRLNDPALIGGPKEATGNDAEAEKEADSPDRTKREAPDNNLAAVTDNDPPAGPVNDQAAVLEGVPTVLRQYLEASRFWEELGEIRKNTASEKAFRKRFFGKFNMFWILKYLHYAEEHGTQKCGAEMQGTKMQETKMQKTKMQGTKMQETEMQGAVNHGVKKMEVTAAAGRMLEMWGKSNLNKGKGSSNREGSFPSGVSESPTREGGSPTGEGESTNRERSVSTRKMLLFYRKYFG